MAAISTCWHVIDPITPVRSDTRLPFTQTLHAGKETGGNVGIFVGATGAGGPGGVGTGAGVGSNGQPQVPAANACAVKH